MMQTVRIFRKREDNFDAMILQEFFKFIGFLVTDFAIEDREKWYRILSHKYDINVRLKVEEKLELLFEEEQENSIWIIGNTISEVFDELLKKEELGLNSEQMHTIINFFKEKRFPAVIYNLQNMNFVTEYIYYKEKEEKILKTRESAFEQSWNMILECYTKLIEAVDKAKCHTIDQYVEYAILNMKYIINQTLYLWKDDIVFNIPILCEKAEKIDTEYPEFIAIQSLKARICLHDNRYFVEAETMFIYTLKKAHKKHVPNEINQSLKIDLYEFCEKVRRNVELSDQLKEDEYKKMKYCIFKLLYQNIKALERKEDYHGIIKLCNEAIVKVLNGRPIELLMPREKIDMYKTYSLLGKAYYEVKENPYAIQSYKMAIKVAETSLTYDEELSSLGYEMFVGTSKINMPLRFIYNQLIQCYSRYGDNEAIKECKKQMKFIEYN